MEVVVDVDLVVGDKSDLGNDEHFVTSVSASASASVTTESTRYLPNKARRG
jgi:hypothetical protein